MPVFDDNEDLSRRIDSVVVAEVYFDRKADPDTLRRLGEILQVCGNSHPWIARISGLDELLDGKAPLAFSKAIFNSATGELMPLGYDPILIWGRLYYPAKTSINPVEILREAIPSTLARVSFPDPDGGL